MKDHGLTCFCGAAMRLRTSFRYPYANGRPRLFYGCSRFPVCDGMVGAHPTGEPLGTPCDAATRRERSAAHAVLDAVWRPPGGVMSRVEAYALLAYVMRLPDELAHVARFDAGQCRLARARLVALYPALAEAEAAARRIVAGERIGGAA